MESNSERVERALSELRAGESANEESKVVLAVQRGVLAKDLVRGIDQVDLYEIVDLVECRHWVMEPISTFDFG